MMPGEEPPVSREIAAVAALTAVSRGEVAPASRVNGGLPTRERRAVPVLVRHARSGVPSCPDPAFNLVRSDPHR